MKKLFRKILRKRMTITEAEKELDELHKQIASIYDKHSTFAGICSYGYYCYQNETKLLRERASELVLTIAKAKDTIQIEV